MIADSKADALAALERWGDAAAPMAGGTSLAPDIRGGNRSPRVVVHVGRLAELHGVRTAPTTRIGAATTLRRVSDDPGLARYDALRTAAAHVGSWQIQGVGTVGGNIADALPAADLLPPLVAHGARIALESGRGGRRTVPVEALIDGAVARTADELLIDVELEPVPPRTADHFEKLTRRGGMEFSIASLALRLTLAEDGATIDDVRIAVGAMGPATIRARAAEDLLRGHRPSIPLLREAAEAVMARTAPRTDLRASADYRAAALPRLFARAVERCAAAAACADLRPSGAP